MPERGNIASEQMFSVCRTIRLPDVAIEDDEARAIIQYLDNALRATQQAMLTLQKLRSIEAETRKSMNAPKQSTDQQRLDAPRPPPPSNELRHSQSAPIGVPNAAAVSSASSSRRGSASSSVTHSPAMPRVRRGRSTSSSSLSTSCRDPRAQFASAPASAAASPSSSSLSLAHGGNTPPAIRDAFHYMQASPTPAGTTAPRIAAPPVTSSTNMRVIRHRRNESTGTTSGDESERDFDFDSDVEDIDASHSDQRTTPSVNNYGPGATMLAAILAGGLDPTA